MKTLVMMLTALSVLTTSVQHADAGRRKSDGKNPGYEQNLKMKAEWQQAREAGGYPDPISAVIALFNGTLPASAIQPVINNPEEGDVTYPNGY